MSTNYYADHAATKNNNEDNSSSSNGYYCKKSSLSLAGGATTTFSSTTTTTTNEPSNNNSQHLSLSPTTAATKSSTKKRSYKKRPPPGFLNVGNTCYANAALQCLFSTALARALMQPKCFPAFRSYSSNGHLLYPIEDDGDDSDDIDDMAESLIAAGNGGAATDGTTTNNNASTSQQSPLHATTPTTTKPPPPWLQTPTVQRRKQMSELCHWITNELTNICRIYLLQKRRGAGINSNSKRHHSSSASDNHNMSTNTSTPQGSSPTNSGGGGFLSSLFGGSSNDPRSSSAGALPSNVVDPSSITRHVNKLSSCLRFGQQEDSHEFLRSLISAMTMDGFNKELSSLFDGLLESSVTCQECEHSSITRDRYMDLSLEIGSADIMSLNQALEHFTRTELLSEENMVQCDRCETKRVVRKGLRLATSPSILVCHLKRFEFDMYGRPRRINKHISFPTTLNISSYMSLANKGRPPQYDLVSMIVHQGSTCTHGHYVAYVRGGSSVDRNSTASNLWYHVSDAVVTEVPIEDVLAKQAYILLYEATGMRHHEVDGDCGSLGGNSIDSHSISHQLSSSKSLENIGHNGKYRQHHLHNNNNSSDDTHNNKHHSNTMTSTTLSTFMGLFSQCGLTSDTMMESLCDSSSSSSSPVRSGTTTAGGEGHSDDGTSSSNYSGHGGGALSPLSGSTGSETLSNTLKSVSPARPKMTSNARSTSVGASPSDSRPGIPTGRGTSTHNLMQRRSSSTNLSSASDPIANGIKKPYGSRGRSTDAARARDYKRWILTKDNQGTSGSGTGRSTGGGGNGSCRGGVPRPERKARSLSRGPTPRTRNNGVVDNDHSSNSTTTPTSSASPLKKVISRTSVGSGGSGSGRRPPKPN